MEAILQRITAATTKVRRLGYFALFSRTLSQNPLTPPALQQSVLSDSDNNHALLVEACKHLPTSRQEGYVTGEILKPDAFKRYLATAKEFGLVQQPSTKGRQGRFYQGRLYNTKRGEVLAALIQSENIFRLSIGQIHLMWRLVLEKDHDYLRNVILWAINNPHDEEKTFFSNLKELWQRKLTMPTIRNVDEYDRLKKAIETSWSSQKRYYKENIKANRLEWLLDLNAIEFWNLEKNRVIFRAGIEKLLEADKNNFSNAFVSYMEPVLKKKRVYWNDIPSAKKKQILSTLLAKSFVLFRAKNEAPKISVDQLLEYGTSVLSDSAIICETSELDEAMEQFTQLETGKYRYVRILSEADTGYVTQS